jgi:superfamily I DNA/RNA helicase
MAKKVTKATKKVAPKKKPVVRAKAKPTLREFTETNLDETVNKIKGVIKKQMPFLKLSIPAADRKAPSREDIRNAVKEAAAQREEHKAAIQRERNIGAPHGIVRARAGTGKTFTMIVGVLWAAILWLVGKSGYGGTPGLFVEKWKHYSKSALGFVPEPSPQQAEIWKFISRDPAKSIRYLAFNKAIVEEFGEKYKGMVSLLQGLGVWLSFSTLHSMGMAACRKAYRLNSWKAVSAWKTKDLLSVLWEVDLREVEKEKGETIDAICELVRLCKITLAGRCGASLGKIEHRFTMTGPGTFSQAPAGTIRYDGVADQWRGECVTDEELEHLATHYDVLLNGNKQDVFRDVRLLLDMSREQTDRIDYEDMLWLPIVNNLELETFDLLMVDEGQDLNRCQQELVLRAGKRIILVGDDCQAIYGFAGADVESIDRMQKLLDGPSNAFGHTPRGEAGHVGAALLNWATGRGVEEYKLTVTHRCGKAIVREAQAEVPEFEAHESNGEGVVRRMPYDGAFELYGFRSDFEHCVGIISPDPDGSKSWKANRVPLPPGQVDMVLCRTNAPLVAVAFAMLREGRKCNIKGRDLGKALKALVKKSKAKNVSDFLIWLETFEQTEVARIQKRRQKDEEALVSLADKCECLKMFAEGCIQLDEMYEAIDKVFAMRKPSGKDGPEAKPEGTLLSSIHRAKGLEAKRVFLLRPDLLPHPMAKSEWARGQEKNLSYVAKTRAIEELVYVDGTRGS